MGCIPVDTLSLEYRPSGWGCSRTVPGFILEWFHHNKIYTWKPRILFQTLPDKIKELQTFIETETKHQLQNQAMNQNQQQPLFNSNTLPQNQIQHAHELISFWKKNNLNSLKVNQKLNISNYNKNDHILNSDFSFSF
jgi:hypothetical protein